MTMTDTSAAQAEALVARLHPGDFIHYGHHVCGWWKGYVVGVDGADLVIYDVCYGRVRSPIKLIDPVTFNVATHYHYADWDDRDPERSRTPQIVFPDQLVEDALIPFSEAAMAHGIAGTRQDVVVYRAGRGHGGDLIRGGLRQHRSFSPGELGFLPLGRDDNGCLDYSAHRAIAAALAGPVRRCQPDRSVNRRCYFAGGSVSA